MDLPDGKQRDCTTALLVDNPENKFRKNIRKAFSKVNPLSSDKIQTREQWKKEIVHRTHDYQMLEGVSLATADRFMTKLEDAGYLEEEGQKLTASKPAPTFSVKRKQLASDLIESDKYERELPLWRILIMKSGDL